MRRIWKKSQSKAQIEKNTFAIGKITESFRGNVFRVEIDETKKVISARCSGRLWKNSIKVSIGNKVRVKLPSNPDEYDNLEGIIVYRL